MKARKQGGKVCGTSPIERAKHVACSKKSPVKPFYNAVRSGVQGTLAFQAILLRRQSLGSLARLGGFRVSRPSAVLSGFLGVAPDLDDIIRRLFWLKVAVEQRDHLRIKGARVEGAEVGRKGE